MRRERDNGDIDLGSRISSLEQFTGTLVPRPVPEDGPLAEVIPIHEAPFSRVPVPRRSRIFLRGGEGHGVFADLTITAPRAPSD